MSQTRLTPNAVTLGDLSRPLQISKFIKDIHAGFQLLNLKNDTLRRRSDGIKYAVSLPFSICSSLSSAFYKSREPEGFMVLGGCRVLIG